MVEGDNTMGKLGADFVGGAERSSCRSRCCILASVGVGKGGNRRTVSTISVKSPGREGGKGEEAVASDFLGEEVAAIAGGGRTVLFSLPLKRSV